MIREDSRWVLWPCVRCASVAGVQSLPATLDLHDYSYVRFLGRDRVLMTLPAGRLWKVAAAATPAIERTNFPGLVSGFAPIVTGGMTVPILRVGI